MFSPNVYICEPESICRHWALGQSAASKKEYHTARYAPYTDHGGIGEGDEHLGGYERKDEKPADERIF